MEVHLSHPVLSALVQKYPSTAGSLFQAYNDIVYAQQWTEVQIIDLEGCQQGAIKGKRRDTELLFHVVPCSLAQTLSFSWLQTAFKELSNPADIYLAITSEDASIVYYKISSGIVKPPV